MTDWKERAEAAEARERAKDEALNIAVEHLVVTQVNVRTAARYDPRWEGAAEAMQPAIDQARAALAQQPADRDDQQCCQNCGAPIGDPAPVVMPFCSTECATAPAQPADQPAQGERDDRLPEWVCRHPGFQRAVRAAGASAYERGQADMRERAAQVADARREQWSSAGGFGGHSAAARIIAGQIRNLRDGGEA